MARGEGSRTGVRLLAKLRPEGRSRPPIPADAPQTMTREPRTMDCGQLTADHGLRTAYREPPYRLHNPILLLLGQFREHRQ